MTRKEQIESVADNYYEDCIIKSYDAFIAGAQWADKTILKEVFEWLDKNFYDVHVLHDDRLEGDFESKEQMLQSFKERFNIE